MTEAEWRTLESPMRMLVYMNQQMAPSDRKIRLFCCACLRRVWFRLGTRNGARGLVEFAEAYVDVHRTDNERAEAESAGDRLTRSMKAYPKETALRAVTRTLNAEVNVYSTCWSVAVETGLASKHGRKSEGVAQAEFVRDIFGNPFRPVAFHPRWRTADVLGLARGIYDERAFDRLPLLADALMDAGRDSDDVLSHCRSDGPHVRGCWVVDLVLGKE